MLRTDSKEAFLFVTNRIDENKEAFSSYELINKKNELVLSPAPPGASAGASWGHRGRRGAQERLFN